MSIRTRRYVTLKEINKRIKKLKTYDFLEPPLYRQHSLWVKIKKYLKELFN